MFANSSSLRAFESPLVGCKFRITVFLHEYLRFNQTSAINRQVKVTKLYISSAVHTVILSLFFTALAKQAEQKNATNFLPKFPQPCLNNASSERSEKSPTTLFYKNCVTRE